jgi:hypothetical protein
MARQAHLEAARLHIDAASKHIAAAGMHHEGDHTEGERCSDEARTLSRLADDKSSEAHWMSIMFTKRNLT